MAPRVTELYNLFGRLHYVFERRKKTGVYILSFLGYHFILQSAVKTVRSHQRQLAQVTMRQYRASPAHQSVSPSPRAGLRTGGVSGNTIMLPVTKMGKFKWEFIIMGVLEGFTV